MTQPSVLVPPPLLICRACGTTWMTDGADRDFHLEVPADGHVYCQNCNFCMWPCDLSALEGCPVWCRRTGQATLVEQGMARPAGSFYGPVCARPFVPLECVINYTDDGGKESWQFVICKGQCFVRRGNESTLSPVSAQYLGRRWLRNPIDGGLDEVPLPSRMASLFYDLAFNKLPYWEYNVFPSFGRNERKTWSYAGVTAEGDLGNRTYKLVVEIAQVMRQRLGYRRLYEMDQLNHEKAGDVLEGIMGLQEIRHDWDPTYIVSEVSIAVYDLWNTPQLVNQWDPRAVAGAMYPLMDLESFIDDLRYQSQVAKVAKKTGILLSIGRAVGFRCAYYVYSFLC